MSAWAEDRALLRSTPSADPGAKTGAEAARTCSASLPLRSRSARLRDWHKRAKPSRLEPRHRGQDVLGLHFRPPAQIPVHGEPRQSPTIFYAWQKQFFENGTAAFERKSTAAATEAERTIAALRQKLHVKNEVVAELMEEHVKLKKEHGEL